MRAHRQVPVISQFLDLITPYVKRGPIALAGHVHTLRAVEHFDVRVPARVARRVGSPVGIAYCDLALIMQGKLENHLATA